MICFVVSQNTFWDDVNRHKGKFHRSALGSCWEFRTVWELCIWTFEVLVLLTLMGNTVISWIEIFQRDVVTAAFAQLWYPFGKSYRSQIIRTVARGMRKFWCPDSTIWFIFYFLSLSLSEIANNRCLNSSQVKNSNWFQKKLD